MLSVIQFIKFIILCIDNRNIQSVFENKRYYILILFINSKITSGKFFTVLSINVLTNTSYRIHQINIALTYNIKYLSTHLNCGTMWRNIWCVVFLFTLIHKDQNMSIKIKLLVRFMICHVIWKFKFNCLYRNKIFFDYDQQILIFFNN